MNLIPSPRDGLAAYLTGVAFLTCVAFAPSLLTGCATEPYNPIYDADFKGPTLKAVRNAPRAFVGTRVRWGGVIAGVENRKTETWVDMVDLPLEYYGRPQDTSSSAGRFIAHVPGFLDPEIYAKGRQMSVVGTLQSPIRRDIGEYPYDFPVVAVEQYELWQKRRADGNYPYYPYFYPYDPFYYDPFYAPYWRSPYYYHRRR